MSNPGISDQQGKVYIWFEIFKVSEKSQQHIRKISPKPITEFQVKLIIWETEDM